MNKSIHVWLWLACLSAMAAGGVRCATAALPGPAPGTAADAAPASSPHAAPSTTLPPAAAAAPDAATVPAAPAASGVAVAVLDYEATAPGNPELGAQIAEILTARLSVEDGLDLVERAKLGQIMKEHHLTLTGLADPQQAAQIGKLVGAKLLVLGKAFMMDKKLMIVTRVVGVETGLVKGTLRSVEQSTPLSDAVAVLADDVAALVRKEGARLLPADARLEDPVAEIRAALGDRPRPAVAVVIPEVHRTRVVIDPAVETEIKHLLLACGYRVMDTGRNDLADWAKGMMHGQTAPWPDALREADLVVVGEAFSEFALRTGDLVTCTGRAEINLISRRTGEILLADRETQRAVDLAEAIAGKTALQKAGRRLGVTLCRKLVDYKGPCAPPDVAPAPPAPAAPKPAVPGAAPPTPATAAQPADPAPAPAPPAPSAQAPATALPAAAPAASPPQDPADQARLRAQSILRLAEALEKAGKPEAARKEYQRVIDQFPNTEFAETAKQRLAALDAKPSAARPLDVPLRLALLRAPAAAQGPAAAPAAAPPAEPTVQAGKRTVFAAPFENETGQEQYDPAAAGMGDLVGVLLAEQQGIRVVERQRLLALTDEQARSLKGLTGPAYAVEAGKLLKADTVLLGRLYLVEGKMTVSARAVDIASERVLASDQLACRVEDILEASLQLAGRLARQMELPLPQIDLKQVDTSPIASLHFAKALSHYYGGNMDGAIMQFMRAIDLDPNYTEVHYWTGLCYEKTGEAAHAAIDFEAYLKEHPQGPYAADAANRLAAAKARAGAEGIPRLGPEKPPPVPPSKTGGGPRGPTPAAPASPAPAAKAPPAAPSAAAPSASPPQDPADQARLRAQSALRLAEALEKAGKPEAARKEYQRVIEQFPNTEFAETAKQRLAAMDAKEKAAK